MKTRMFSIMDTKRKRTGGIILCLTLVGITAGAMVAFATPNDGIAHSGIISFNDGPISTDGGQTWIDEKGYQKLYPIPNIVWWTYNDYNEWVAKQREILPGYIGEMYGYYDNEGVLHKEVWTQEKVDEAIRRYEEILQTIKNGGKFSMPVNGNESIGYALNPSGTPSVTSSHGAIILLKNGETKDLGSFVTTEERLLAVKAFCEEQVKAGRMTQQEADKILNEYK
jgi:hypothetical protein